MSQHQNKELVLQFFDEVFNDHQPYRADKFIARDALAYTLSAQTVTQENLQQMCAMLYAAFPDCHITVQDITAERDIVVTRSTFSGTHRGMFKHLSPTGKSVSILIAHWMRIINNQILECWIICDDLERALSI